MARLRYSSLAIADFKKLYSDLEAHAGVITTLKYRDLFYALFRRLEAFPEAGMRYPSLGDRVRIGIVAPYLVIFRPDLECDAVQILRVVHGKQNITPRLLQNVRF